MKIGDKVVVVAPFEGAEPGWRGTIKCSNGHGLFGIQMSHPKTHENFHNCGDRLARSNGYWVDQRSLRLRNQTGFLKKVTAYLDKELYQ